MTHNRLALTVSLGHDLSSILAPRVRNRFLSQEVPAMVDLHNLNSRYHGDGHNISTSTDKVGLIKINLLMEKLVIIK